MANDQMRTQISGKAGFIAALDQSGGSTPGALRLYGIPDSAYSGDAEMFRLMHEMRVRIMTAPAFTGARVVATILFEATMDGEVQGKPVPAFLWEERGVVPFLKVDKGLEAEKDGVQPDEADAGARRAARPGGEARHLRHQDALGHQPALRKTASPPWWRSSSTVAAQIARHGLMPILEPEVSIKSPDKAGAGSHPSRGTDQAARRPAGRPPGDAQADARRMFRISIRRWSTTSAWPGSSRSPAAIRGPTPADASPPITA